jgi:hypothetical protein
MDYLDDIYKDFYNETDHLDTFFYHRINSFCLIFNGKFYSYKTRKAFLKKRDYFILKYSLTLEKPI